MNLVDLDVVTAYFCDAAFRGTLGIASRCSLTAANVECVPGQQCGANDDCESYNCNGTCIAPVALMQFLCG
jgi:hypothetical protein